MASPHVGTLLISCPDQKGIVAAVAQMLFALGANIVDSDQHTDRVRQPELDVSGLGRYLRSVRLRHLKSFRAAPPESTSATTARYRSA